MLPPTIKTDATIAAARHKSHATTEAEWGWHGAIFSMFIMLMTSC